MSYDRKMYPCTCSDCGKASEVPFEPKADRPVYCKECLPKHQKPRFQKRY
ncbi:MAG: DNA-directed RNA polymerase [Nitrososphaeria archaeon]|nr:DNA-directed RNA polymerase [Nitrososphaeria archaeon]NDB52102.1 DNA-directed RNA polymerase [Nitrosopumilaceae archaeon]NDB88297.1 DNA-directed RNA polymerase [Nitrososphaerota archaeon]NDB46702.1 DNA-directed RNA polymerase [Nitrososphaeria archaeon]NDB63879.1 DNA-directed RNA polymerase [Nitrosopumilaceae archaeon]